MKNYTNHIEVTFDILSDDPQVRETFKDNKVVVNNINMLNPVAIIKQELNILRSEGQTNLPIPYLEDYLEKALRRAINEFNKFSELHSKIITYFHYLSTERIVIDDLSNDTHYEFVDNLEMEDIVEKLLDYYNYPDGTNLIINLFRIGIILKGVPVLNMTIDNPFTTV